MGFDFTSADHSVKEKFRLYECHLSWLLQRLFFQLNSGVSTRTLKVYGEVTPNILKTHSHILLTSWIHVLSCFFQRIPDINYQYHSCISPNNLSLLNTQNRHIYHTSLKYGLFRVLNCSFLVKTSVIIKWGIFQNGNHCFLNSISTCMKQKVFHLVFNHYFATEHTTQIAHKK